MGFLAKRSGRRLNERSSRTGQGRFSGAALRFAASIMELPFWNIPARKVRCIPSRMSSPSLEGGIAQLQFERTHLPGCTPAARGFSHSACEIRDCSFRGAAGQPAVFSQGDLLLPFLKEKRPRGQNWRCIRATSAMLAPRGARPIRKGMRPVCSGRGAHLSCLQVLRAGNSGQKCPGSVAGGAA